MDDSFQTLLQKVWHCTLMCEKCANESILRPDHGHLSECIRLSQDCAEICVLLAKSIKRQSILLPALLDLCEWICNQCARECNKHPADHCQQCAAACLLCSEACYLLKERLQTRGDNGFDQSAS
ncbi:MAG TPA: four-helix bundle copper-binding protein [Parapedobacter sp.]|uniref:four-helix bundle copper-binding protein n=1 Tax=Parapedobacter sp. TaxID=1958893 RepID=UPI002C1737A5|nr:four-helix bundle copper-binding protein [Parapedobacter sp.]HWK58392.1 four-helix bundle copper-binding protein [Parapedobacter sp.]